MFKNQKWRQRQKVEYWLLKAGVGVKKGMTPKGHGLSCGGEENVLHLTVHELPARPPSTYAQGGLFAASGAGKVTATQLGCTLSLSGHPGVPLTPTRGQSGQGAGTGCFV